MKRQACRSRHAAPSATGADGPDTWCAGDGCGPPPRARERVHGPDERAGPLRGTPLHALGGRSAGRVEHGGPQDGRGAAYLTPGGARRTRPSGRWCGNVQRPVLGPDRRGGVGGTQRQDGRPRAGHPGAPGNRTRRCVGRCRDRAGLHEEIEVGGPGRLFRSREEVRMRASRPNGRGREKAAGQERCHRPENQPHDSPKAREPHGTLDRATRRQKLEFACQNESETVMNVGRE
jgi:hypothetical protein